MNDRLEEIILCLDAHGIFYELQEHEPVKTSEQAARVRGVSMKHAAKSMIAQSHDTYILLVLPGDMSIDWKLVKKGLNLRDVHLASQEDAERISRVEMGGMAPMGNIFHLPTYFDSHMSHIKQVHFNAGSRSHTITMEMKDLLAIVNPLIFSFAKIKNDTTATHHDNPQEHNG